jgi:hypothetical protein
MSKKKENVFSEAGLSEQDVRAWQKTKPNLADVKDKALAQLYSRVVLKKQIKKPYPVFSVGKIWEEINLINSGQKTPTSRKLFVGIKDAMVVGLSNSITYNGCPKCLKGQKKIGASKCAGHGIDLVELESLSWNEWLVYDDDDEFIIKMSPSYMNKYNELNMIGSSIYVDGVIDLDQDPILLMVNNVRDFEPGSLMPGAEDPDGQGDDFTVGREEVALDGFDDEEIVEEMAEDDPVVVNPFKDPEDDVVLETLVYNGVSEEFKNALIEKFKEAVTEFAVNPVKFIQVERYMLDWIEQKYPLEFDNNETAVKKLWEFTEGLYKKVDDDRLQRLG